MRWSLKWMILAGCALLLAAGPARAAVGRELPAVAEPGLRAHGCPAGGAARACGWRTSRWRMTEETAALVLERFEVFAKDATITVHGDAGDRVMPAPANAYFRGVVDGKPGSRVFLARLEDGRTQG